MPPPDAAVRDLQERLLGVVQRVARLQNPGAKRIDGTLTGRVLAGLAVLTGERTIHAVRACDDPALLRSYLGEAEAMESRLGGALIESEMDETQRSAVGAFGATRLGQAELFT